MSSTTSIAVFAVLDLAVISALAAVCAAPFRLGRRRSGPTGASPAAGRPT